MADPAHPHQVLRAQHDALRRLLHAVRSAAAAILEQSGDGREAHAPALRSAVGALREALLVHLDAEETLLTPLLEAAAQPGTLRLFLLRAEHSSQRAMLDGLRPARLPQLETLALACRSQWLVDEILDDMTAEESDLFV
jgi:hypothetical protein